MKHEIAEAIIEHKIIVIIRGVTGINLLRLTEALVQGGIRIIEITFDQSRTITSEETAEGISLITDHFVKDLYVGAGTVLNVEQVEMAYQAGAKFIISPNVNPPVIKKANLLGILSIPGAMTPTEIQEAHDFGADFIKVFPAGDLGISYFKSVLAPLNHIKTLAVGGVDEKNLMRFINAGAYGVGVGSNIVNKSLIESQDFHGIVQLAKEYTSKIK